MDAFWLVPVAIVGVALFLGFYAYIKRQPLSPGKPQVLVDKTSGEPSVDQATKNRDWSARPCGSFMDWLAGRG